MENYYNESEITESINLCDEKGSLNSKCIGWAREPLFNCNLSGHTFRKKKWNYWCIVSDDVLFSITIANLDYAGMVFAYFYDFKTERFIEKTISTPFGKGCSMPDNVFQNIYFKNDKISVSFEDDNKNTRINIHCKEFGKAAMDASFVVKFPLNHETMNVVIPWNRNTFQFTSKQNCLPVEGYVNIEGKRYTLLEDATFACLDFGRGVWPYDIFWNWATCSGKSSGRTIGFNLGAKWTDGTGMTENAIIVDGKVIKLSEDVEYIYDSNNIMKPWHIKTKLSDRVDVYFNPIYKRTASTKALIVSSTVYQMIGEFSGKIKPHDDEVIEFSKIKGCAEEHKARW
jgi:hypothetical protein